MFTYKMIHAKEDNLEQLKQSQILGHVYKIQKSTLIQHWSVQMSSAESWF